MITLEITEKLVGIHLPEKNYNLENYWKSEEKHRLV